VTPSDFHLFGPLKEALGGKGLIADDEVKLCAPMPGQVTTNFLEWA